MSPKLIILRGPPAAGKTTVSVGLRERFFPCLRLSLDTMRSFLVPRSLTGDQLQAVKLGSADMAIRYLERGFNCVIEGVFQDVELFEEVVYLVNGSSIEPFVFTLRCSLESAFSRNSERSDFLQSRMERIKELYESYVWTIGDTIDTDDMMIEDVISCISDRVSAGGGMRLGEVGARIEENSRVLLVVSPLDSTEIGEGELFMAPLRAQARGLAKVLAGFRPNHIVSLNAEAERALAGYLSENLNISIEQFDGLRPDLTCEHAARYGVKVGGIRETYGQNNPEQGTVNSLDELEERFAAFLARGWKRAVLVVNRRVHAWLCRRLLGLPANRVEFRIEAHTFSAFQLRRDGILEGVIAINGNQLRF